MNKPSDHVILWWPNLHDAFLNASLQRKYMYAAPIDERAKTDGAFWLISERGRFERAWVNFLYVLVEAWRAPVAKEVREWIAQVVDTTKLEELLAQGDQDGSIEKMAQNRHYMSHRDKREYWDVGRAAVLGQLQYHEDLHMAFSKVFLDGFAAIQAYWKQSKSS